VLVQRAIELRCPWSWWIRLGLIVKVVLSRYYHSSCFGPHWRCPIQMWLRKSFQNHHFCDWGRRAYRHQVTWQYEGRRTTNELNFNSFHSWFLHHHVSEGLTNPQRCNRNVVGFDPEMDNVLNSGMLIKSVQPSHRLCSLIYCAQQARRAYQVNLDNWIVFE
jgi:hypothetical protein